MQMNDLEIHDVIYNLYLQSTDEFLNENIHAINNTNTFYCIISASARIQIYRKQHDCQTCPSIGYGFIGGRNRSTVLLYRKGKLKNLLLRNCTNDPLPISYIFVFLGCSPVLTSWLPNLSLNWIWFYWWTKPEYPENPPTSCKSLINFIT
jgi:hypothetical protein